MRRLELGVLTVFAAGLVAAGAFGLRLRGEAPPDSIGVAAPSDDDCTPRQEALRAFERLGATETQALTRDQLMFARGLFVSAPPTSPYPSGEAGLIALSPDGRAAVAFLDGDRVCGRMVLPAEVSKLLVDIGKSI